MSTRSIGEHAEQTACEYLKTQGYQLRTCNYHCKFGEIDLIMDSPEGEIVFIEVRFRKNKTFGGALESITSKKQQRIEQTAHYYLQQHHTNDRPCRFDVIAFHGQSELSELEWIENAF